MSDKPTLAIVGGTGTLGSGLARRLAAAGYAVILGSRSADKAAEAARALPTAAGGPAPRGMSNADAAKAADVVIITVPRETQAKILDEIAPHVTAKLVVDTTVPLVPPRVARVQLPPEHSAALTAQKRLGASVRMVSAFHNVAGHPKDRAIVADLAKAAGLRGVHAGPLANSVAAEALTSVLIGINRNYKVDGAGIRITGI